jgi:DNA-binding MarR family transcriptional regulator
MATRKGKLGPLTPRGREILAYVFNSIAFSSHDDNCDVETLAERLGLKPGILRRTLAKMTDAGYVTVEGSAEYVYPTVTALLKQEPELTEKAATSILKRVRRRG